MPRPTRATSGKPVASSLNSLLQIILEAAGKKEDIPGPEWASSEQIQEASGLKISRTNQLIRNATEKGLLEKKMFRRRNKSGFLRLVAFYRQNANPTNINGKVGDRKHAKSIGLASGGNL